MAALLGLHSTNSRIPVTSIAAFAANTNTEAAFEQFCKDLYQVGATEDMIGQKRNKILAILRSQGMVASSQIGSSDTGVIDQVLETAYQEYCNDLYRIGFTEDMVRPKEGKIRALLRSRGMVSSSVSSSNPGGSIKDKGQLLQAGFPL